MFLHMSVILFTRGLCMMSLPVWLPGPMFLLGVYVSGPMFFRGSLSSGMSLCVGFLSGRGVGKTPWTGTPSRTVKRGRYASYWNAFLFVVHSARDFSWNPFIFRINLEGFKFFRFKHYAGIPLSMSTWRQRKSRSS